jgi:thiamine-monophosphate kinase
VELRSGIDLSDGLAGDAGHLSAASGVGVVLEAGAVPIHPGLTDHVTDSRRRLHLALRGGEDYEVCFSAPGGAVERWADAFQEEHGIPLTRIGTIRQGAGVEILDTRGKPSPLKGGFSHFQEGKPG